MHTKTQSTIVIMPDETRHEVSYYCMDKKLSAKEKQNQTQLFIQLDDCLSTLNIEKSICSEPEKLEKIVHNRVINSKGHLC